VGNKPCMVPDRMKNLTRNGFTNSGWLLLVAGLTVTVGVGYSLIPRSQKISLGPSTELLSKEKQLKEDLYHLRSASYKCMLDTNGFPRQLKDVTAKTSHELSTPNTLIDGYGNKVEVDAKKFKGPYLKDLPKDPISGLDYKYSIAPGYVGNVNSSADGVGSDGRPYSGW